MKNMAAVLCLLAGITAGCSNRADGNIQDSNKADCAESKTTKEVTAAGAETTGESSAAGAETEILVAAAASLKNVYEEDLIPMFQEKYPQIRVKGTYDSSGKLQVQIEEGLGADVFMPAAVKQMKALDEG